MLASCGEITHSLWSLRSVCTALLNNELWMAFLSVKTERDRKAENCFTCVLLICVERCIFTSVLTHTWRLLASIHHYFLCHKARILNDEVFCALACVGVCSVSQQWEQSCHTHNNLEWYQAHTGQNSIRAFKKKALTLFVSANVNAKHEFECVYKNVSCFHWVVLHSCSPATMLCPVVCLLETQTDGLQSKGIPQILQKHSTTVPTALSFTHKSSLMGFSTLHSIFSCVIHSRTLRMAAVH